MPVPFTGSDETNVSYVLLEESAFIFAYLGYSIPAVMQVLFYVL